MYALSNQELPASVFATEARGDRSDKYRFVPTIDILTALKTEGFQPVSYRESRALDSNNRPFVRHALRLRREQDIGRVATFEDVIPEIALTNSHDGTSGFRLDAALHRLICSNGLILGDSIYNMNFRHSGKDDLAERIIEGAYSIVEDFPVIADTVGQWRRINLTPEQRNAFAVAALPLRFDADDHGNFPVGGTKLLTPRRYGDSKPDLWTTFNVVQENIIKGGLHAGYKDNRRQTTRKITAVDKDNRLNKALWTLAAELAKTVH